MKQRLRKIIQLSSVFLLVLFISCEKDLYDMDQPQNKYSIKEYSFKNARAKSNNASSKISEGLSMISKLSKSSRGEISDLVIDSTTIKEISIGDYTTYTMLVKSDKPTDDYFENLIIEVDGLNETKAYLIKYTPSTPIKYVEAHNSYNFTGTSEKYQYPICIVCPEDAEDPDSVGTGTSSGSSWYTCITVMMCSEAYRGQSVGVEHIATSECTNTYPRSVCGTNISTGGGNTTGSGSGGGVGPSGGQSGTGSTTNTTPTNPITVIVPPVVPTPCEKLSELTDLTKANIIPNINWLKSKVNDGTNIFEHGVEFEKNVDNLQYTNTNVSSPNENSVPMSVGGDVYGGAHCHTWAGHKIFSFGDLELLVQFYDGAVNADDATIMLVCRTSLIPSVVSTYAIKVGNIERLKAGIKAMYRDPKLINVAEIDKKNRIMKEEGIFYDNCNGEYEKSFLKRFASFGISLYKATDNLDSWNKLQIATPDPLLPNITTVTQIPCTTN